MANDTPLRSWLRPGTGSIPRSAAGRLALCLITALAVSQPALAAIPQNTYRLSPDITIDDGSSGAVPDEAYMLEIVSSSGGIGMLTDPLLPPGVEMDALTKLGNDTLFSVDTTVQLGSIVAAPEDVVSFDGVDYTIVFDGSAEGLVGANVDAVAATQGDLLISFDTTVLLGGSLVIHDHDVLLVDDTTLSLFLDGAAAGIDPALDIDALHRQPGGRLLVSFDTSGTVGGVTFDDEDVLEYTIVISSWEMSFDATAAGAADWPAADVNAMWAFQPPPPTPACGLGTELVLLLPALALFARGRRSRLSLQSA